MRPINNDNKLINNKIRIFSVRDFNDFSWLLIKKLHDTINMR
jgi:hypothetical protein